MTHLQLGSIYSNTEDLNRAVHHYREAVQLYEQAGDLYGAAQTRFNVALALFNAGTRGLIAEIRGA